MDTETHGSARQWCFLRAASILCIAVLLLGSGTASSQAPPTLPEAIDREEDWAFETGGSAPWFGQIAVTHDGVDAAQ